MKTLLACVVTALGCIGATSLFWWQHDQLVVQRVETKDAATEQKAVAAQKTADTAVKNQAALAQREKYRQAILRVFADLTKASQSAQKLSDPQLMARLEPQLQKIEVGDCPIPFKKAWIDVQTAVGDYNRNQKKREGKFIGSAVAAIATDNPLPLLGGISQGNPDLNPFCDALAGLVKVSMDYAPH